MILRIDSGPLKGKSFPVEENIVLGRSKGNILLKDPRVSNPHAQIHKANNQYILKNLSSKRSIHYKDKTVSFVILQPGVVFQIGSTILRVDEESSNKDFSFNSSIYEITKENEEEIQDLLINQLESSLSLLQNADRPVNFLENPLKLHFEKGAQKDVCWSLSYLPRKFGSVDADLPLIDPKAPEMSFELFLENKEIVFSTPHKDIVLLNYQHTQKKRINHGDLIIVGAAYIRCTYELA